MHNNLEDFDYNDKRVLLRVGFDMPLDENGEITDDTRIVKSLPTIKYLIEHGAKLTVMSHMGRPKGETVEKLKMNKVAAKLSEIVDKEVRKVDDCVGVLVKEALENQGEEIIFLENLRFHAEEKKNDPDFAKALADGFDYYVDDAFGVVHRAHASVAAITEFIPSAMGLLVKEELEKLGSGLNPEKPMAVIIGGAKISTKLGLIKNFLEKADYVLLGGAMIFTFYRAKGWEIGKSLFEEEMTEEAKALLGNEKIILPEDIVVAKERDEESESFTVDASKIPADFYGLDIGEKSVDKFKSILNGCRTVIWNGPMGLFEIERFAKATYDIAGFLASSDIKIIVGGGDSVNAIKGLGVMDKFYHVSTGGGASLEFLEGKELPGIKALEDSYEKFKE